MGVGSLAEMVFAAVLAIVVALSVCLRARPIASRLSIFDIPNAERKQHRHATPLVGGLALIAAFGLSKLINLFVEPGLDRIVLALGVLLAVAFTLGFLDDRRAVNPRLRLAALGGTALLLVLWQNELALTIIYSGVFGGVQDLWWFGIPLGAFAIAGMANAVNMADGVDGLVPGVALIWSGLMAPWALAYAPEIVTVLVSVAAAMAVIFVFNLRGRLFMGDSGAYVLGVLFGALALYLYNRAHGALPAELVALWFGALIFDVWRLSVQRVCQGRSPMSPDREHLHHLLGRYLPRPAMLVVYWALVLVPGLVVTLDGRLLTIVVCASFAVYFALVGIGYAIGERPRKVRVSLLEATAGQE